MPPKRACRAALLASAAAYLLFLLLFEAPSVAVVPATHRPSRRDLEASALLPSAPSSPPRPEKSAFPRRTTLSVSSIRFHSTNSSSSSIDASAASAFAAARPHLVHLLSAPSSAPSPSPSAATSCPATVVSGPDGWLASNGAGVTVELPCGMAVGSRVTVVARPRRGASSQFMVELLGTKAVRGEEPPRILHFNPRIRGDFSGRPVIELNTCYRMQWAQPQRCEGRESRPEEDTVDGKLRCEKWSHEKNSNTKLDDSRIKLWMNRLIGKQNTVFVDQDRPYPFAEGKQFVLTIVAGLKGYHIDVDGRHVASFPYRTGYSLEDATGLSVKGDLDVESISAGYLPNSPPTFSPRRYLEMSEQWKASPLPTGPVELFIGILSATNHFAERMAVRKSWMISTRRSPNVVARFFVALSREKEVNEELRKEAEYFGDIVIVPFMDSYDLVVLKTIAIAEYGVRVVPAKYIMKCDDDTFVRLDSVMDQVKKVQSGKSIYVGNMNYYHRPLRSGKWGVTYEEWPEEVYPPYANGPGYVISSEIAEYIISEFDNKTLRLFKMEDVSMGLWVEKFSLAHNPVEYLHDLRFYQPGCFDGYFTAHYQSPQHMICLWRKLQSGRAQCCNVR